MGAIKSTTPADADPKRTEGPMLEMPAEVSKRGVMIGILREPSPAGEREPDPL